MLKHRPQLNLNKQLMAAFQIAQDRCDSHSVEVIMARRRIECTPGGRQAIMVMSLRSIGHHLAAMSYISKSSGLPSLSSSHDCNKHVGADRVQALYIPEGSTLRRGVIHNLERHASGRRVGATPGGPLPRTEMTHFMGNLLSSGDGILQLACARLGWRGQMLHARPQRNGHRFSGGKSATELRNARRRRFRSSRARPAWSFSRPAFSRRAWTCTCARPPAPR